MIHQLQLVDRSDPAYKQQTNASRESHQLQLVDRSGPAYKEHATTPRQSTNFSWWIVQVQPTVGGRSPRIFSRYVLAAPIRSELGLSTHYYICFRTHRRKETIADKRRNDFLTRELSGICEAHDYHLLRSKV